MYVLYPNPECHLVWFCTFCLEFPKFLPFAPVFPGLFPLRQLSHELPCLDGYRVILGGCRPGTVKEERSTLLFNTRSLTGLALLIRARLAGRFSGIYPCFSAYTSKGYFTQLIYVDSRVGIQGSHPCVLSTLLSPKPHFFAFTFETGSH